MKQLHLSKKQRQILTYLFSFRFLTTHQIQLLLQHKNPNRILAWLKDLREKDCVRWIYKRETFAQTSQPATFYLGPKARHVICEIKLLPLHQLNYIYQESRREIKFIEHSQLIATAYLYFLKNTTDSDTLKFFTKADLIGYDYFPYPKPDAFITRRGEGGTKHYFLDIFDEYTPRFVLRERVKTYLQYKMSPLWETNTNAAPYPRILFICPNEKALKHILHYARALFKKPQYEQIAIFLTTKKQLMSQSSSLWQEVEL